MNVASILALAVEHGKLLFWALIGLLVAAYIGDSIRVWYRLKDFKGPFSVGFSTFWLVRSHIKQTNYLDSAAVCEKYGSIARVGPNYLVTDDPDLFRRMSNVRTKYRRAEGYVAFQFNPGRDNLLSVTDDKYHTKLRSMLAAGYMAKEINNVEQIVDANVLALTKLIDEKYISTAAEYRPMDLGRKASYFTLDVLSSLAFGEPFGDLATDSDVHQYIETIEDVGPAIVIITLLPWIRTLLQLPFLRSLMPTAEDKSGFGKVMGIANAIVADRYGSEKKAQQDMLGSFIAHGLSQKEAESEIVVQINAGSDTSSTAIRVTFLYIVTNPRVLSKFLSEISEAAPSHPITEAEAKNMPYLQAIIREGLRLWSPVTDLMFKKVPAGGDTYNGIFIPETARIGYSSFGAYRKKSFWGQDANEFNPERWFGNEPHRMKEMEDCLGLVFGFGKYGCMGKGLAMMELNKIFVELFRRYDFTLLYPAKPWKLVSFGLFSQSQMWMKVSRREKQL